MTDDGPTPDDFAAAARTEARVTSASTLACVALLVAAVALIALGTLTPTSALVGAFLVAVLVAFPCAPAGARADARWLPGREAPGGRRVQPLAPPSPEQERDGAPFQVALSWADQRHDVSDNLTSTPPAGGDPWSELVEAGRALVDEARGPAV